jgi:hypothetical protein
MIICKLFLFTFLVYKLGTLGKDYLFINRNCNICDIWQNKQGINSQELFFALLKILLCQVSNDPQNDPCKNETSIYCLYTESMIKSLRSLAGMIKNHYHLNMGLIQSL